MLRLFVLALILANGAYFAWSHGLLRAYGFAPAQQTEPQRLAQQIQPSAVRIVPKGEAERLEAQSRADQSPKTCLTAGPFNDSQTLVLRRALELGLPEGSWQIESTPVPERWIIYMGKFPDATALTKKRGELQALRLAIEAVHNPDLEPGLSLGGFESRDAATQSLEQLTARGVRTARVVLERAQNTAGQLTLPAVSDALKQKLEDLKPALAGKPLKVCG
jgi:hypothetical protein